MCQKLFEFKDPKPNSFSFADVLSRSLSSSDQEIRAEALALIEKVLELWPDSAEHLNQVGIAAKLNLAKASHVSGETLQDTHGRLDRLSAILKQG